MGKFKEELNKVRAFIFDVDGVLASNTAILATDGDILRTTNTKDGFAIHRAITKGYKMAIITGGNSPMVELRYKNLGIEDIYSGVKDKTEAFNNFIRKYAIEPKSVLYMGDDIPDYPVMKKVGIPVCPKDAVSEIKSISHYVSDVKGGEGCVRDVIEQVLKVHGNWIVGEELQNSYIDIDFAKKW